MPNSVFLLALMLLVAYESQADVTVGQAEESVLIAIRKKFQCCFENQRDRPAQEQYAVMYWGDEREVDSIDINECNNRRTNGIFWTKPNYNFKPETQADCKFVAGRVKKPDKHTEKTILWSFRKEGSDTGHYTRCPTAPKDQSGALKSIYMFTYNSPCTDHKGSCTSLIAAFADKCKEHFKHLYIGYVHNYENTAQLAHKDIDRIKNTAMKEIPESKINCTGSKDCRRMKKTEL